MRNTVVAALAFSLGVVLGATGWALLGLEETTSDSKADHVGRPAATATQASVRHYKTAQDIADALTAAGFTVSMLHKETEDTYISDVGGTAYNFTVTDQAGQSAPGDAGINMFPNAKALENWTGMSQGFGGIAVTGDTWAVSLPTTTQAARTDSQRLAPKLAKAPGGTVQR